MIVPEGSGGNKTGVVLSGSDLYPIVMRRRPLSFARLWLPVVLSRATLLLFVLAWLVLLLYLAGNFQGFADETMFLLYTVEAWILALGALLGVFSAATYAITLPFRRRLELDKIILSGAASAFCLALYMGVALIRAFLEPFGV